MGFFELLEERRSVRKFKDKGIPEEHLQKILLACSTAPSAGNLQAFKIFVAKNLEKKRKLAEACSGQAFVGKAPIVLVFCADENESAKRYGERGKKLYAIQDASISAAYCQLAAASLGLASCWVGSFDEEEIQNILQTKLLPVAVIPVGFAAETPRTTPRKSLKELVEEI